MKSKLRKRKVYAYRYIHWDYDTSHNVTIIAFNRKAADKEMSRMDKLFSFVGRFPNSWGASDAK